MAKTRIVLIAGLAAALPLGTMANAGDADATVASTSGLAPAPCFLQPGGESAVLEVLAPQTLHLADGRFVRLAEVFIPPRPEMGFDPSVAAMEYIRNAALGQRVEIKFGGTQRDRYGVYLAHVFVKTGVTGWLQEGLIKAGLGLAYPQSESHACIAALQTVENTARQLKLGSWGLAVFKVFDSNDRQDILNAVQTYRIVQGTVLSVSGSGTRTYLNFGQDRLRDFTAAIEQSAKRKLPDMTAATWPGTAVRIRGWIERRRGPFISVLNTEQIEFLPLGGSNGK